MFRDLLSDLAYRLRRLVRRDAAEREMADELRFHLDREVERLVAGGLSPHEARRRARHTFGDVEQVKEAGRDAWGVRALDSLGRDFVQSLRLARRQPGFSSVVLLSLALGLGVTLTAFGITWNILFADLPLPHPEQLVHPV